MARLDAERYIAQMAAAQGGLAPLHILCGDEPLLVTEAADALRAAAGRAGYDERVRLVMDARSDWSALPHALQSVSLFGGSRLVDLSLPGGKPGKTGGEALQKLAAQASEGHLDGTLVMVQLPRLDRATRQTRWAQALDEAGTWVDIDTVERDALPAWIGRRLARQQQQAGAATLAWMAEKVEGNLLAAHQEILKLGLLHPAGELNDDDVRQAVLDVARHDVFGLRDAMLAGDAARALRILASLQAEGEGLPLVLWAVGDEVRVLARLSRTQVAGGDVGSEMRRQRVFGDRERFLRQTLSRQPAAFWPAAVRHAHDIDRLIKGLTVEQRLHDPWEELARLVSRVAIGAAAR